MILPTASGDEVDENDKMGLFVPDGGDHFSRTFILRSKAQGFLVCGQVSISSVFVAFFLFLLRNASPRYVGIRKNQPKWPVLGVDFFSPNLRIFTKIHCTDRKDGRAKEQAHPRIFSGNSVHTFLIFETLKYAGTSVETAHRDLFKNDKIPFNARNFGPQN